MANRRLLNLDSYSGVLPYASELFGVYQPMIGWHSKRIANWLVNRSEVGSVSLLDRLADCFESNVRAEMGDRCEIKISNFKQSAFKQQRLKSHRSKLLTLLAEMLEKMGYVTKSPGDAEWKQLIQHVDKLLDTSVARLYNAQSIEYCQRIAQQIGPRNVQAQETLRKQHALDMQHAITYEANVGGVLGQLAESDRLDLLEQIFYERPSEQGISRFKYLLGILQNGYRDPFETFDPTGDLRNVTLSPIGITHIFRQYFFELDTFLGTPVAHLYVPPGSTTEIVEVSTRKTIVEKTIEQSIERIQKKEESTTLEDEISEAVKQDNKQDMKLGVSSTVEQSWGTGNVTATASLNMDSSQASARESTHKRMRQQSTKLSSEIRENFKTTFKTVTETTDTVSKRYVISNPTADMVNYELRRKMRQVAVQIQDVGTYLCWDTFVDDPGTDLGLSSLVHMSRPPDLVPVPPNLDLAALTDVIVPFTAPAVWDYDDRQGDKGDQFVLIGSTMPPPGPEGYDLVRPTEMFPLQQQSASGEDFHQRWAYFGRFTADPSDNTIQLGVWTKPTGIGWDERIDFVLQGSVKYTPNQAKKDQIAAASTGRTAEQEVARQQNDKLVRQAYFTSARERIEQASSITKRKYEDLREEERIVVYRRLIRSIMTEDSYANLDDRDRHVISQLLNSIFDIDKMLYFVAPEWWKPRERASFGLGFNELSMMTPEATVTWRDSVLRPDNYLITDKSAPAAKGSSLGWLLQLDGDDLRNAFLNAPWVKAVLPVRPGRELAAINWLKSVNVEGADGLDASYAAPADQLAKIREGLGLASNHTITLDDAIRYLCKIVAEKHAEGSAVSSYPETEINDDNKVLATPIEKVYEHGFYPLQGGFRVNPTDPGPDGNNQSANYQVFDQWIEILPTDQIVPVAVTYDPKTGRQL